jgi:hypothetical protein
MRAGTPRWDRTATRSRTDRHPAVAGTIITHQKEKSIMSNSHQTGPVQDDEGIGERMGRSAFLVQPKRLTRSPIIHSHGQPCDVPHESDLCISVSYNDIWFGARVAPELVSGLKRDWESTLPKLRNPNKYDATRGVILQSLREDKAQYPAGDVRARGLVAALIWLVTTDITFVSGTLDRHMHYEISDHGPGFIFKLMF